VAAVFRHCDIVQADIDTAVADIDIDTDVADIDTVVAYMISDVSTLLSEQHCPQGGNLQHHGKLSVSHLERLFRQPLHCQ
jgi:hypothetical protein